VACGSGKEASCAAVACGPPTILAAGAARGTASVIRIPGAQRDQIVALVGGRTRTGQQAEHHDKAKASHGNSHHHRHITVLRAPAGTMATQTTRISRWACQQGPRITWPEPGSRAPGERAEAGGRSPRPLDAAGLEADIVWLFRGRQPRLSRELRGACLVFP
jgi:hypothetical protein